MIFDLIDKLGKQERSITETEIVSPVFNSRKIAVQIERLTYYLSIPEALPGWYKFKPINNKKAKLIGPADIDEKSAYLKFLQKIRLIPVFKENNIYYGIALKSNPIKVNVSELWPIYLPDDSAVDFNRCICRFDGANLWYDSPDPSEDPIKVDYLTQALKSFTEIIQFKGLALEDKVAYGLRYKIEAGKRIETKTERLKKDVGFAGGSYIDSKEKSDHYTVTYAVDGHRYTSIISKDPRHQVLSAGICLSGGDREFDLKSLISVIREGQEKNLIHRTA